MFNEHGEVVNYQMILTNTRRNCSGGRTPWNTWLSCEEVKRGKIYEVDPFGNEVFNGQTFQRTRLGDGGNGRGARFEAVTVGKSSFCTLLSPSHHAFKVLLVS